jgi:folate-binding protein YgfZ
MLSVSQLDSISHLPDLVLCPLDSWDLICVKGDDRIEFLQGQLTCDFNALKVGDQTLAAQCDPQGKVWSVLRVIVLEDRVLLTQPSSVTAQQMPALQKYAAFSKVEICKETEFAIFGLAGCKSAQYIAEQVDTAATHDKSRLLEKGGVIIKQPYPSLRYMAVLPIDRVESLIKKLMDIAVIYDDSLWEAMNIASGIGFIEEETVGKFIPQMLNLQYVDAISFTKGCYIGQETIARAKYRGANKRALFILTGRANEAPVAGQTIEMLVENNWKRVGTVISGCQYGDKHVEVLAVLPKECSAINLYQVKELENSTLYYAPLPYPERDD